MSSPYKNLLLDSISFNHPVSSYQIQTPLVNNIATPKLKDTSLGSISNIEKFIDEKYENLSAAKKVYTKPSNESHNNSNKNDDFLNQNSLYKELTISLKDQIEILKSEVLFLRGEICDKNSLIKHLLNFHYSKSSSNKNLDIILGELNKSKDECIYSNEIHISDQQQEIPDQRRNLIHLNNNGNNSDHKINNTETNSLKDNSNLIDFEKNDKAHKNPFSNTPLTNPDSQISPTNPFNLSDEGKDENSHDIDNKNNNDNIAALNPSSNVNAKANVKEIDNTNIDKNDKSNEEDIDDNKKKLDGEKKSIYIVGDSIVKELRGYELSKSIKQKKLVKVRTHPGGKTSCLSDHLKPVMRSRDCDHIIIHVGTNDLRSEKTPVQISHDIINLAYAVRQNEIKVSISGLIQRNDDLNEKVLLVNDILVKSCESIDIPFINHKNIRPDIHLNASKVHLNKKGNSILIANLRKYLCN